MKTNQEIFDISAAGLLAQGAKSLFTHNGATLCRYRGDAGRKCAIGFLIPDEAYTPEMEGRNLWEFSGPLARALDANGVQLSHPVTSPLLDALQNIHDDSPDASTWPDGLRLLAKRFGLSAAVVDRWESDLIAACS